jgi:pimeloyl-ACP methyl ester carboxylesterase
MTMNAAAFHAARRFADTASGRIAYVSQGDGPPAVFLHGVPLNGFHWRHVVAGVADLRRCIALDLLGLGYTETKPGQDLRFTAQAEMVRQVCDALGLDTIDLVANDSGGAIAQLFAAKYPKRLRSLTLTNCDAHDNWPPAALAPTMEAAKSGALAGALQMMAANPDVARSPAGLGVGYADPNHPTDEALGVYAAPLLASPERAEAVCRFFTGMDCAQTVAIEAKLRELTVPTLVVWAQDDVFFAPEWGRWLRDTIPGVTQLVEVPEAKLFFPEDRPDALIGPLRAHWGG